MIVSIVQVEFVPKEKLEKYLVVVASYQIYISTEKRKTTSITTGIPLLS